MWNFIHFASPHGLRERQRDFKEISIHIQPERPAHKFGQIARDRKPEVLRKIRQTLSSLRSRFRYTRVPGCAYL